MIYNGHREIQSKDEEMLKAVRWITVLDIYLTLNHDPSFTEILSIHSNRESSASHCHTGETVGNLCDI